MKTLLKIGPGDQGRAITWEEFRSADWQEGFRYELIGGKLAVSPTPNPLHDFLVEWLHDLLKAYARANPSVINYVSTSARVFIPEDNEQTAPQPDLVAFADFPVDGSLLTVRWWDLIPLLVVEVVSEDTPEKDLVRNVELYRQMPLIREYWVVNPLPAHRSLLAYRRRGQRWQKPIVVNDGETYTARFLPGLSVTLDLSRV